MPKYPEEIYKIAKGYNKLARQIVDDVRKQIPYDYDICYRNANPWYLSSLETMRIVLYLHTSKQAKLTGSRVQRLHRRKKNG